MVFNSIGVTLLSLLLKSNNGLEVITLKKIAQQTLEGLAYLHDECKIIHSDIKPDNILVTLPKRRMYGIVKKVMESRYKGPGMTMNAAKKYFTDLDSADLKNIFDSILSDYDGNANLEVGDELDIKKRKLVDKSNLQKYDEDVYYRRKKMEPGTSFDIKSVVGTLERSREKHSEVTRFLMDPEVNIKIIDFGGSVNVSNTARKKVSTFEYRAPEVIVDDFITPAADMWSFGCTVCFFRRSDCINICF